MCLINYVRLTTFYYFIINLVVIMQNSQEKADLLCNFVLSCVDPVTGCMCLYRYFNHNHNQNTKVNATKIRKVRADGYKLRTGKKWRLWVVG